MVARSLRVLLVVVGAAAFVVCSVGMLLNESDSKHSRAAIGGCRRAVIALTSPDKPYQCCDGGEFSFWSLQLCHVTFHWSNRFVTALLPAWSLPLLPNLTTLLHDIFRHSSTTPASLKIGSHLRRFLLYTVIIVLRTVRKRQNRLQS